VLLCRLWRHCGHNGVLPAVLCNVVLPWPSSSPPNLQGRRTGVGSRPRSLVVLLLVESVATILSSKVMSFVGLDGLKRRPLSWFPSHSGWSRTSISSGRIWTVGLHTFHHRSTVLSCLRCVTQGWCLTRLRGLLSPRSLWSQCGVPALIRADVLGRARSLPVPPRGQDEGEVVRSYIARGEG
jgi:hypothetical protein